MTPLPCRIETATTPPADVEADWLVVGVPQGGDSGPVVAELDARLGGTVSRLREAGDLTGKHLELVPILTVAGIGARRLLLVGLGPTDQASRATTHDAFAAALRSITGRRFGTVALVLPPASAGADHLGMVLGAGVGAIQGSFGPGLRKAEPSRFPPERLVIVGTPVEDAFLNRVRAEATALTFARELVNTPPCDLYPESFAARAAEGSGQVECDVWDETRLEAEGMGAILGVARGAARPPRFVLLRYRAAGDAPTLALVGKGVTFDSGGLSLKQNDQMVDMKSDMAGAAAVLAAVRAIAELGLRVNLLGIIPLVENMPGGRALKLGDVLRARSGKTIEVLNTDAEGRLILADALAYAAEQKPGHIVDLATLTGSCMVALGTEIAGLMTNNDVWGERVRSAARQAGERAWPLPMDPDFEELLKSKVADLKNVPPSRYGGAIAGGKFLEQFVAGVPWVHLDIAGPAWADHESPVRDPGGTGAFVRTLIELATTYSPELDSPSAPQHWP
jgi:leucyl aminopeptidase